MKICVLGLGYVGLPTAVLLADAGNHVIGVDINLDLLLALRGGQCPVTEPGLKETLDKARAASKIEFRETPVEADAYIIAVPTPITADRKADVSYVEASVHSVIAHLKKGALIVVESTVPPGCLENVVLPKLETSGLKVGTDLMLAYCPERVVPGHAMREMRENARIVGGYCSRSTEQACALYKGMVTGPIYKTGVREAELVKLAENAYRDLNVAFANTLANVCEASGVDVRDITSLANHHPRVNMLKAGPGVGGHCIPVDPWFLVESFPEQTQLLAAARAVNDGRPARIIDKAISMLGNREPSTVTIAALGISYKPNVDDTRQSPSVEVVQGLIDRGYHVRVCDPEVADSIAPCAFELTRLEKAIKGAHLLLCLVGHNAFTAKSPEDLKAKMAEPKLVLDVGDFWPHL